MWQCQWLPGYTSLKAGWLQDAPSIGVVLLNRPDKSNAFDGSLWQEFPAAVAAVGKHPKTRVVSMQCWTPPPGWERPAAAAVE
jgi:hypothetical protein